jgi:hypothetical protein
VCNKRFAWCSEERKLRREALRALRTQADESASHAAPPSSSTPESNSSIASQSSQEQPAGPAHVGKVSAQRSSLWLAQHHMPQQIAPHQAGSGVASSLVHAHLMQLQQLALQSQGYSMHQAHFARPSDGAHAMIPHCGVTYGYPPQPASAPASNAVSAQQPQLLWNSFLVAQSLQQQQQQQQQHTSHAPSHPQGQGEHAHVVQFGVQQQQVLPQQQLMMAMQMMRWPPDAQSVLAQNQCNVRTPSPICFRDFACCGF